jgi:hypothetical protein
METQERRRLHEDRGTEHPSWSYEQRAQSSDDAITEPEAWRTRPGAVEDQQPLLEEERLCHDGAHADGSGQPRDGREHMHKKGGQITHAPNPSKIAKPPKNVREWDFPVHGARITINHHSWWAYLS